MSDLRDEIPLNRTLDFTKTTSADKWTIELDCWTYSGVRQERVFPKQLTVKVSARDFDEASYHAKILCETVQQMFDIWLCKIAAVKQR